MARSPARKALTVLALSATLLKQVADIRREISQLHAQAKNAANK